MILGLAGDAAEPALAAHRRHHALEPAGVVQQLFFGRTEEIQHCVEQLQALLRIVAERSS